MLSLLDDVQESIMAGANRYELARNAIEDLAAWLPKETREAIEMILMFGPILLAQPEIEDSPE